MLLQKLFHDYDGITVLINDDYYSNHWLTAILIDQKKKTTDLPLEVIRHKALEKTRIESRPL
jgi:hypothetical protein